MSITAIQARRQVLSHSSPELIHQLSQPRVMARIRRGIQDSLAGRTKPWAEVKAELGITA